MARYNEILTGRHNNFIKKLFGMKGRSPAPQLSGDIQMSHPISHGNENRFLEEWRLWGGVAFQASNAGTSGCRLRNPTSSNVVAVVYRLSFSISSANTILVRLGPLAVDLATPQTPFRLDNRFGIQPGANCILTAGPAPPSFGGTIDNRGMAANLNQDTILTEQQEIPLLPGDAIQVDSGSATNVGVVMAIFWRERFLEDSERA